MQKFSLKVSFFEWYPSIELRNNKLANDTKNIVGTHYPFVEYFSEVINCTLNLTSLVNDQSKQLHGLELLKTMFKQMKNNELNMVIIPVGVGSLAYNKSVVIGNMCFDDDITFIVPVIRVTSVNIAFRLFLYLLMMFGLATLFYSISYVLIQVSAVNWNCLSIFQIFIGMVIPYNPKTFKQRIFFIALTFLSIKYSSTIFTEITQSNILTKEIEFNSFEDISKFNLTSCVPLYYESLMRKHENKAIQNIMQYAKVVENSRDCIEESIKHKCACVLSKFVARFLIEKYRNVDGTSNVKLSKLIVASDKGAFIFEQASPFVHKFNSIMQRIVESGIRNSAVPKWNNILIYSRLKFNSIDKLTEEKVSDLEKVVYILSGGYCISLIAFIIELCISFVKFMHNK